MTESTVAPSPEGDPQTEDDVAASQQEQSVHKRDADDEEDDKKPAAKDDDDKKPAIAMTVESSFRYYAIRKCDSLKAPAIFLSWEDCNFYVEEDENEGKPEYEEFESLEAAKTYIDDYVVKNLSTIDSIMSSSASPSTPSASSIKTKKRSAQAASLDDSASDPKKKTAPNNTEAAASLPASTTTPAVAAVVAPTCMPYNATTPAVPYYPYMTMTPTWGSYTNYFNPAVHIPKTPQETQQQERHQRNQTQFQQYADSWYAMVHLLQKYKDKEGHCDVPWKNEDLVDIEFDPLCNWVKKTRQQIKKFQKDPETTFLTEGHVKQLLDMGFIVDLKGRRFRRGGKLKVTSEEMDEAGKVVKVVKPFASEKRTQAFEETFEEMMVKLQEYKEIYGHCDVQTQSKKLGDFKPLGKWVYRMRERIKQFEDPDYKKPVWHLTHAHIKRLTDVGFNKTTQRKCMPVIPMEEEEKDFEENLDLLKKTLKEKKSIREVHNLQYWIGKQRVEYEKFNDGKPSRMTAERLVRLAEAGFNFKAKVKMSWEERAKQWREYVAKHGTDPKRTSEDGLGKWCTDQRVKYYKFKKGVPTNMTEEKIQKLTEWGFNWEYKIKRPENTAPVRPWKHRYTQLVEFKEEHGHCLVPQHFPALGNWVHTQRMDYRKFVKGRKSAMSKERLNKLNEIGFVFYTGKGGGKRTPESVFQRLNNPNTKAKKPSEESESSDEEEYEDPLEVQERTQNHHLRRPNSQQVVQDPLLSQQAFAPWDRYHLGRHN